MVRAVIPLLQVPQDALASHVLSKQQKTHLATLPLIASLALFTLFTTEQLAAAEGRAEAAAAKHMQGNLSREQRWVKSSHDASHANSLSQYHSIHVEQCDAAFLTTRF